MIRAILGASGLLLAHAGALAGETPNPSQLFGSLPSQATFIENSGRDGQASTGRVFFGANGEVRWDRESPYKETLVANQAEAWHVDYGLDQAVAMDPDAVRSWQALTDPAVLSRHYQVDFGEGVVTLKRESGADESQWPNMSVGVDSQGQMSRLTFSEEIGHSIEFFDWTGASEEAFDFTLPAGMDVIGRP